MKTMKIYEPAMCCPTGLCGVGVDPELLRISTVLNTLKQNGVEVQRFNLTNAPAEFVKNKAVTEYLQKFGPDKLPVVLVDDFIVIAGRYPSNAEFTSWLELPANILDVPCCEDDTSCCCGTPAPANCCCEDTPVESCCCDDTLTAEGCCTDDCCADDTDVVSEGCCTDDCCSDTPAPKGCCAGDNC